MFVYLLADEFSGKEVEKSHSGIQIGWETFKQIFADISSERFSYVTEETFSKAKNFVYTIIGTSKKSEDVIAHSSVKSGVTFVH